MFKFLSETGAPRRFKAYSSQHQYQKQDPRLIKQHSNIMAKKLNKKADQSSDLQAAAILLSGILRTGYIASDRQSEAVRNAVQFVVMLRSELKLAAIQKDHA